MPFSFVVQPLSVTAITQSGGNPLFSYQGARWFFPATTTNGGTVQPWELTPGITVTYRTRQRSCVLLISLLTAVKLCPPLSFTLHLVLCIRDLSFLSLTLSVYLALFIYAMDNSACITITPGGLNPPETVVTRDTKVTCSSTTISESQRVRAYSDIRCSS